MQKVDKIMAMKIVFHSLFIDQINNLALIYSVVKEYNLSVSLSYW